MAMTGHDGQQTDSTFDVSRSRTFAYTTIRGLQPIADRFCRQSWEVPSGATALRLTKTMQEDARQRNMGTTLSPFPLASALRIARVQSSTLSNAPSITIASIVEQV